MQRSGGGEVAEAMVIHNAEDGGVLEAGDGLAGLVVVGQDDELGVFTLGSGLDGVDERRGSHASVLKELGGLGGKRTQAAGGVGVALVLNLVEQLGQDDGRHDGVVVGVLVSEDEDVCHEGSSLVANAWMLSL